MSLILISQCAKDLDFSPSRPWPQALPAMAWNFRLLTGFERDEGLVFDLSSTANSFLDAVISCYPSLGLAELARFQARIEKVGGLIRKMPQTSILFLIASLAICGLPPLNGFISEFVIYAGLFSGIRSGQLIQSIIIIIAIFSLAIIGGLAMLCFTKAFSIVFLGTERHPFHQKIHESDSFRLFPKYIVVLFIVAIGVLPQIFINIVAKPVSLFAGSNILKPIQLEFIDATQMISLAVWVLIFLSLLVLGIKKIATSSRNIATSSQAHRNTKLCCSV